VALINQDTFAIQNKVVLDLPDKDFYGGWIAIDATESHFMVDTESSQSPSEAYFFVYSLPDLVPICNSSKSFQQKTHSFVYQFVADNTVYITGTATPPLTWPQQLQGVSFSSCQIGPVLSISPKDSVLGENVILNGNAIYSTLTIPSPQAYDTISMGSVSSASGISFSKSYKMAKSLAWGLVQLPNGLLGVVDSTGVLFVFDQNLVLISTHQLQMSSGNLIPDTVIATSTSIFLSVDNADYSYSIVYEYSNVSPYGQIMSFNATEPMGLEFANQKYVFGSSYGSDPFWYVIRYSL